MMKVRELIALLQTFDQELPVTGFNGHEETDFVSAKGVRLKHSKDWEDVADGDRTDYDPIRLSSGLTVGVYYDGDYVDIMGF